MCTSGGKTATNYFRNVSRGVNPYSYRYGASVCLYCLHPDDKHPAQYAAGSPIYYLDEAKGYIHPYQFKKDKNGAIVNVGVNNWFLATASGYGNTINAAVERAYSTVDNTAFREMMYRPKSDFMSMEYPSSILNRLEFLKEKNLI